MACRILYRASEFQQPPHVHQRVPMQGELVCLICWSALQSKAPGIVVPFPVKPKPQTSTSREPLRAA